MFVFGGGTFSSPPTTHIALRPGADSSRVVGAEAGFGCIVVLRGAGQAEGVVDGRGGDDLGVEDDCGRMECIEGSRGVGDEVWECGRGGEGDRCDVDTEAEECPSECPFSLDVDGPA